MVKKLIKNVFIPLLNRIKALEYNMGLIADYVVEEGTSGIWTYRKWHSGKSECWGSISYTGTVATGWGQGYIALNVFPAKSFPSNLFASTPITIASLIGGEAGILACSQSSQVSATSSPTYHLCRLANLTTAKTFYAQLYAFGLWK